MRPTGTPIGLQLALTSKAVARAFGAALTEVGGSLPTWLVLTSLRDGDPRTQLDLARAVGVDRDTGDRRAVRVELTDAGVQLHGVLLTAAIAFNKRLTAGMSDAELKRIADGLVRLEQNVRD